MRFVFKHIKTPVWAKEEDIYYLVIDENRNEIGYIGLQDVDFQKGFCKNLCYKTNLKFRGKGYSKHYLKDFIESCPFDFDMFKATVRIDNEASIKMLEYCGFVKVDTIYETIGRPPLEAGKVNPIPAPIGSPPQREKSYVYKLKKFDF